MPYGRGRYAGVRYAGSGGNVYTGGPSDVLGAAVDSVVRGFVGFRSESDSSAVSDVVLRSLILLRTISDALVSASDLIQRSSIVLRTITESVTSSDVSLGSLSAPRSVSVVLTAATDVVTRSAILTRLVADVLTVTTDLASTHHIVIVFISESLGPAVDSIVRQIVTARGTSDALSMADAVIKSLGGMRSASDSTSIVDAVTRLPVLIRAPLETNMVSEAIARSWIGSRLFADVISIADAVAGSHGLTRVAVDVSATSDVVSRFVALGRPAIDVLSAVVDATARQVVLSRSTSDLKNVLDTATAWGQHIGLRQAIIKLFTARVRPFKPTAEQRFANIVVRSRPLTLYGILAGQKVKMNPASIDMASGEILPLKIDVSALSSFGAFTSVPTAKLVMATNRSVIATPIATVLGNIITVPVVGTNLIAGTAYELDVSYTPVSGKIVTLSLVINVIL